MNYWACFPGDYSRDTGDLTLAQHGAYFQLLNATYGTEAPLPASYECLYRLTRAMSRAERAAVRTVADRFFPICDDGLRHNKRADVEIVASQKRIETARVNGAKGGRARSSSIEPTGVPTASSAGIPPASRPDSSPTPTPTPTPYPTEALAPRGDLSPALDLDSPVIATSNGRLISSKRRGLVSLDDALSASLRDLLDSRA